jgi:hypothetical protein
VIRAGVENVRRFQVSLHLRLHIRRDLLQCFFSDVPDFSEMLSFKSCNVRGLFAYTLSFRKSQRKNLGW